MKSKIIWIIITVIIVVNLIFVINFTNDYKGYDKYGNPTKFMESLQINGVTYSREVRTNADAVIYVNSDGNDLSTANFYFISLSGIFLVPMILIIVGFHITDKINQNEVSKEPKTMMDHYPDY